MIVQNLSILIVESEIRFAQEIVKLVKEIGCQVIACIRNMSEIFSMIKGNNPDLILLNVNIKQQPEDVAIIAKLKTLKIPIVLISSFKENYDLIKSSHSNAIGHMVKPADKATLKSCIEIAIREQSFHTNNPTPFSFNRELFFKKRGVYHKIDIDSIYFFQANGDYSLAQTFRGDYTTSLRLNKLEEVLQNYFFMRVHRSYLINLAAVTSIDIENFWLSINGHKIPFSRRIKTKLLSRIPLL